MKIRIDQRYPLAEVAQAHRELEARKTTGCTHPAALSLPCRRAGAQGCCSTFSTTSGVATEPNSNGLATPTASLMGAHRG